MSDTTLEIAALADPLRTRDPLPPLTPLGAFDAALTARIDALAAPSMTKAVLHLMNDDLASAHPLAQAAEGTGLGDWTHAVIHRREGDYGNSRYWLGRAARFPALAAFYGPDPAAPGAFVDQCRRAGPGGDPDLEQRQQDELAALFAAALKADH